MIKVGQTVPMEIIQAVCNRLLYPVSEMCGEKTTEGKVRWSIYYASSALCQLCHISSVSSSVVGRIMSLFTPSYMSRS